MSIVLPEIYTKRLKLRPISEEDAASIYAYAKDPEVSKYTLWEPHQSVKDSLSYIKDYILTYYEKGIPEPFGIETLKSPGQIIGTVGCFFPAGQQKTMELAYALAKEHWGKGFITEAARAVVEYCFSHFDVERVQCRCKTENIGSFRVMEKLGMTYEGTLRSSLYHRERFWDMKYYSVLKAEWK